MLAPSNSILYSEALGSDALFGASRKAGGGFKADIKFIKCPGYEDARIQSAETFENRSLAHMRVVDFALKLPVFRMLHKAVFAWGQMQEDEPLYVELKDSTGNVLSLSDSILLALWLYKKLMLFWINLKWVHAACAFLYSIIWGDDKDQGSKAAYAGAVLVKSPQNTWGLRSPSLDRAMTWAIQIFFECKEVSMRISLPLLYRRLLVKIAAQSSRMIVRLFRELVRRHKIKVVDAALKALAEAKARQVALKSQKENRYAFLEKTKIVVRKKKERVEEKNSLIPFGLGASGCNLGSDRAQSFLKASLKIRAPTYEGKTTGLPLEDSDDDHLFSKYGLRCVHLREFFFGRHIGLITLTLSLVTLTSTG